MIRPPKIFLAAAALVAAGCATKPEATFTRVAAAPDAQTLAQDRFYLQRSVLRVDLVESRPQKDGPPVYRVALVSAPEEHRDFMIGVTPKETFLGRTSLTIVKHENTDLVKSVGVEAIDQRLDAIAKIGSIAKLAGVGTAASDALRARDFPFEIRVPSDELANQASDFAYRSALGVDVTVGSRSPGAVKVADFPFQQAVRVFPYASCRSVTVSFKYTPPGGDPSAPVLFTGRARIADPSHLEAAVMPMKGRIQMHSECGASILPEQPGTASSLAIVEAVLKQVDALGEAKK